MNYMQCKTIYFILCNIVVTLTYPLTEYMSSKNYF